MNTIPITILDNFLESPNKLREFALSLKYNRDNSGSIPGSRTLPLQEIHPFLYDYIGKKVLSLFYENVPIKWESSMMFQTIPNIPETGWIHQDPTEFTCILYLSHETNVNCGTSLYSLKTVHPYMSPQESDINKYRIPHHLNEKVDSKIFKQRNDIYQKNYKKIMDIKDIYNRIICFPSNFFHSANYFTPGNGEERLTLVMFFQNIFHTQNPPIIRSKKISMT